jgi:hypothetical protein
MPAPSDRKKTKEAASKDPLIDKFLQGYDNSYFDWGDDPSFFAANELLNDTKKASWGVCRPDVRDKLIKNDLVVFFCGRQDKVKLFWRYYFIGFGTVKVRVERVALWKNPVNAPYRKFYNVLARLSGKYMVQEEKFHPYHDDWISRAEAPYILFNPEQSAFNLISPHHVATWHYNEPVPETWNTDTRSKRIERLLFTDLGIDDRRLRTAKSGYGHAKLNLIAKGKMIDPENTISHLKKALYRLV